MADILVDIQNLTKHFGSLVAVDQISFQVARGEVLGFLGPNGAGKSTTMKMITGFLTPTSGTAIVHGHDVNRDPLAVKRSLGYLPEGAPAYPDMHPEGFLHFVAEIRGFRGEEKRQRVERAMELTNLEGVRRQTIDTLSKGFKRRVGLAQAILHDPEVLILDEPTDGLDPNQKHEVRTLIKRMARDKVIILSTHILEEVHAVCTRAIIIARGRVLADGTPDELEARSRYHNSVILRVRGEDTGRVRKELAAIPGVASVEEARKKAGLQAFRVFPKAGALVAAEISEHGRRLGWQLEELHVEQGRLDEVFRTITGGEASPDVQETLVAPEVEETAEPVKAVSAAPAASATTAGRAAGASPTKPNAPAKKKRK